MTVFVLAVGVGISVGRRWWIVHTAEVHGLTTCDDELTDAVLHGFDHQSIGLFAQ